MLRKTNEIILPDGLKKIGLGAFEGCTSLKSITIPKSVAEIGDRAFAGCGLSEIMINNKAAKIHVNAFINCPSLRKFEFPDGTVLSAEEFMNSEEVGIYILDYLREIVIGGDAYEACKADGHMLAYYRNKEVWGEKNSCLRNEIHYDTGWTSRFSSEVRTYIAGYSVDRTFERTVFTNPSAERHYDFDSMADLFLVTYTISFEPKKLMEAIRKGVIKMLR